MVNCGSPVQKAWKTNKMKSPPHEDLQKETTHVVVTFFPTPSSTNGANARVHDPPKDVRPAFSMKSKH